MEFVFGMIDIRYRGIEAGTNKWKEGSLVRLTEGDNDVLYIVDKEKNYAKVYPASIGMSSGETDINGREIFVGDNVRKTIISKDGEVKTWDLIVSYARGIIFLGPTSLGSVVSQVKPPKLEIVGNRIKLPVSSN